ncbi:hypothetical protein TSUD_90990 [Trifolium subterraneum]|uniref:Uncharacterized protein n=1 Tax=Trifolium subterraneum TaxID=3900 RepID=A0A2Z6P2W9_TRISU|nr:hypothetical protein TSUD_90990 [Trifolium subterraneum]
MALNVPHLNAEGFPQAAQPVVRSRWSPAEDQLLVDGMNNFQDIQALISKFKAVKNDDRFVAGLANRSSLAAEMIVDQPTAEVVVNQLALVVVQPAEDNVNDQGPDGNQPQGGGGNGAEDGLA